jgi:hypothetical protein
MVDSPVYILKTNTKFAATTKQNELIIFVHQNKFFLYNAEHTIALPKKKKKTVVMRNGNNF